VTVSFVKLRVLKFRQSVNISVTGLYVDAGPKYQDSPAPTASLGYYPIQNGWEGGWVDGRVGVWVGGWADGWMGGLKDG
jgi:hypothetical protein